MKILAMEPYYGGSHKAFLDDWIKKSRHQWTVLGLPPYKWKWRMRHAAVSFADDVNNRTANGAEWDLIFCSDMLNLAEFLGLVNPALKETPTVSYFHENQLTYPVRHESERDYQFAMTNLTTALSASQVWFNSSFHRDSFLSAMTKFLKRMPDHQPLDAVERIRAKSAISPQGIDEFAPRGPRKEGPARILWVARWEFDKNPELFFRALEIVEQKGIDFRTSVIGEQFRDSPEVFQFAREKFKDKIDHWGFLKTRAGYKAALSEADIVVSTADHEFFGISIAEAVVAGAYPLLPDRLAYPELLNYKNLDHPELFFYDGGADILAEKIGTLVERINNGESLQKEKSPAQNAVKKYLWKNLRPKLDEAIENVTNNQGKK
jgi:glycosyltransferase involved in cell wall biosynthesis